MVSSVIQDKSSAKYIVICIVINLMIGHFMVIYSDFMGSNGIYLLVMTHIAMESHHVLRGKLPISMAMFQELAGLNYKSFNHTRSK